ncbi:MAG: alpha/beta fold hydrolase [Pseudobdellovibrionaceae bacterium]
MRFILKWMIIGVILVAGAISAETASGYGRSGSKAMQKADGFSNGFVRIRSDRELYVEFKPAKQGQPTVILLNGLTYSTSQWSAFSKVLEESGVGILKYDMYGQGQTLLKYAPVTQEISYQEQVQDLKLLLSKLPIQGPYNLVGLSYGGGIAAAYTAQYPDEVKNLILMAPFTEAIKTQEVWIQSQIWATRQIFPYNKYSDVELYDYFLKQIIYATYPQAEPVVLENPFKLDGVFHLVQGIRKYSPAKEAGKIPARTLHLMVSLQDQYIPEDVLQRYWQAIPAAAKASRLFINGSEHKIPEAVPHFAASWVIEILKGNPALFNGDDFLGEAAKGQASSKDGRQNIRLGKN